MSNKERQKRYKENHPDSWKQTSERIGLKATIRLYTDKEADQELLTALEAAREEGESDRDLILRMVRKGLGL